MAGLPLEGIRIVDLTMVWAGPYATRILADMGAEVIKIESVDNYDLIRTFVFLPSSTETPWNKSAYFNHYNRGKLGVTLNLAKDRGKELFRELVKISDVVIENYRADVMERLGFTYEALKEIKSDIIMVGMPGRGSTGPERLNYAYGPLLEANSGLISITGYADGCFERTGISYGDPIAGTCAAGAVALALHYRRQTGKGQYIDISQIETLTRMIGEAVMDWSMNQRIWGLTGNRHSSMAPHGCYRCQGEDTWVTIAVQTDEEWESFCRVIGNPPWTNDVRFTDVLNRWQYQDELDRRIEEWTITQTPYEVMHSLQDAGIAAGVVMDQIDLLQDPHLNERQFWGMHTHPDAGTWRIEGPAWRLSEAPAFVRKPAPCFGQHNDYLFRTLLNLSDEEIAELEKEQIIGTIPNIPASLLLVDDSFNEQASDDPADS